MDNQIKRHNVNSLTYENFPRGTDDHSSSSYELRKPRKSHKTCGPNEVKRRDLDLRDGIERRLDP
ncbi:hypothetical protein F511_25909 [Dorcoceras hygrometricum]|uniref:Uncharacterized protein n=1 Tax=Dorcoceras hygrometricum TaxID=472368 RepID=A0A2Z7A3M4_9LAMI|nr:hypothetical protein F511_25909 [Dorcoceras hygrometricum]